MIQHYLHVCQIYNKGTNDVLHHEITSDTNEIATMITQDADVINMRGCRE